MTTLTATPQPATASVALALTPTGTVTQILRADANGIRPVRAQAGQFPTSSATALIDNEAALTGPVSYTVVGGGGASATTALDVDAEWLTVPVTPARSERVDAPVGVSGYASARESQSTVHRVIDRPDPVITLGVLALRTGSMELWCPDIAAARRWEAVYARGEVVLLRQGHAGLDMYHTASRTGIEPQGDPASDLRWRLTIDYIEVAYPAGNQLGTLGWSVDDVTATYPTVAAVTQAFATVNDLTIGPL